LRATGVPRNCISPANNTTTNNTNELLTEFFDGAHANEVQQAPPLVDDTFADGYTPGLTLGEWFSRPVKIRAFNWSANSRLGASFNPWYDYFSNPEIKAKLKGFSRLQANLHLKLVINASPYHYGMGIMSYKPMSNSGLHVDPTDDNFDFSGGEVDDFLVTHDAPYTGGLVPPTLMVRTCRPHAKFYAAASKGCEMQLPFCYYQNWINLDTDLDELKQMGNINIYTPMVLLDSSGNSAEVSVTIYAWCDDHKVAGPSYVMQSGQDEYKSRPVSTMMSAMSKVAGALSYVPSIKPYAMATSGVLAGASNVARWFGFSNPPVITDVVSYAPNYMSNFASPEISVQQDKLSLDPKNEVTVDSRTVGLDGVDHMSVSHIVGREVDYEILYWQSTMPPETPLLVQHVSPMVLYGSNYITDKELSATRVQMTPAAQMGTMFEYWSGCITYKFTVVASQFHRGRLMVTYEPDGFQPTYTSASYTGPRTINKIWDISEDPTFELEVPWMAPIAMLRTTGMPGVVRYANEPTYSGMQGYASVWAPNPQLPDDFKYKDSMYNGTITVSVLNALTSNDPGYEANIVCSVNCGGVEYFSPMDFNYPFSLYKLEGGDDLATAPEEGVVHAAPPSVVEGPTKHVVYTGEIVRSVRQLLHRTCFYSRFSSATPLQIPLAEYTDIPAIDFAHDGYAPPGSLGTKYSITSYTGSIYLPNSPYPTGKLPVPVLPTYPSTGILIRDTAPGGVAADIMYNQNNRVMTPTAYLTSAYVGWRGGTVYTAKLNAPIAESYGVVTEMVISRVPSSLASYVQNASVWNPMLWSLKRYGDQSLPITNTYAPQQCLNLSQKGTNRQAHGISGMAVTNPGNVDVVNAVVPYYSNNRMMPANPIANYYVANKPDEIVWNKAGGGNYPAGTNELIQCPRIDYNVTCNTPISGYDIDKMPSFDVYHKAGVDYTAFWYLNPPTVHFYLDNGGVPTGWS
jgi:hypothetical protein